MEQRQIAAVVLLLLVVMGVSAQDGRRRFFEVGTLNSDINRLEELSPKAGRTLVFLVRDDQDRDRKDVIVTDSTFQEQTFLGRFCGIEASEIRQGYWDYHTGISYLNDRGWCFIIEKGDNGFRAVEIPVRQLFRLTFRDGPGDNLHWIQLGNGDAVRKDGAEITVYNPRTNEVFFQETRYHNNILWPGGTWIIPTRSSAAGWGEKRDLETRTMLNYKTGEERSFYPDIILGAGKNLVMTTGQNLIGLTIRNLENEILYRDAGFDLLKQMRQTWIEVFGWPTGYHGFGFGFIDLPYVYLPLYQRIGPTVRAGYVVLDLREGKAYYSAYVTYLLGAFE
jgi:hypothetical protein